MYKTFDICLKIINPNLSTITNVCDQKVQWTQNFMCTSQTSKSHVSQTIVQRSSILVVWLFLFSFCASRYKVLHIKTIMLFLPFNRTCESWCTDTCAIAWNEIVNETTVCLPVIFVIIKYVKLQLKSDIKLFKYHRKWRLNNQSSKKLKHNLIWNLIARYTQKTTI